MGVEEVDSFDPYNGTVPYDLPLSRLKELQERARWLLEGRTVTQLKAAINTIEWLVQEYFYKERELWITSQLENGGPILRFLDYADRTHSGLRNLIENCFDIEVASEFYFPQPENTSELEALVASLDDFDLDEDTFPNAKGYEYVAVLALRQIADAISAFSDDSWPLALKDDIPIIQWRGLANYALNAMESVCHAESLRLALRAEAQANQRLLDKMRIAVPAEAEALAKKKVSLAASKAAKVRHSATAEKKARLLAEWDATGGEYESRADFARIVSQREGMLYRTLYDWIAVHDRARV